MPRFAGAMIDGNIQRLITSEINATTDSVSLIRLTTGAGP